MRAASSVARVTAVPPPTSSDVSGEFSFEVSDFERVRSLIYAQAGISLHAGKQAMVYSRLSRRLRETGHRSFGAAGSFQPLQVGGERAVAGLAQPARQPAVDHGLLAGVQADAGVLVNQLAHALEVGCAEAELLVRAVVAHGGAQGGKFDG